MKIKLRYIFFVILLILSFNIAKKLILPSAVTTEVTVKIEDANYIHELRMLKSTNALRRGEIGTITIQGYPRTKYTIKSTYAKGIKTFEVTQQRTSDEYGQVTFLWSVAQDTSPGTYPVTIKGDGKTLNLYHTVLQ